MKLKWTKVGPWVARVRVTGAKLPDGWWVEIQQARGQGDLTTTGILRNPQGKLMDRVPLKSKSIPAARSHLNSMLERRYAA